MHAKTPLGICALSATFLSACNPDPQTTRIVARVGSPDGTREAVYAEDMSGGATIGPSGDVYVVRKGRFPQRAERVFSEERTCNLRIRWLNNDTLEIGYFPRTARSESANAGTPVQVQTKWLGADATNGC